MLFYVLIFSTGQWTRIIPVHWDVFPNAVSVAIQYASLNWPVDNGWVNYNALQLLAYFVTVFIAAPLAILTGWRMSGAWPRNAATLNKIYPVQLARAIHLPVMIYFVLFIVVHVTLVLATGALRNLNHMYGGSDVENWVGFWIFAASLVVTIAAWVAARPLHPAADRLAHGFGDALSGVVGTRPCFSASRPGNCAESAQFRADAGAESSSAKAGLRWPHEPIPPPSCRHRLRP